MGFYISHVFFNKTSALTIYGQLWMRQKTADDGSHHLHLTIKYLALAPALAACITIITIFIIRY